MPGEFDHAALRRQIAAQDGHAATRLERAVQGADHFLTFGFRGVFRLFGQGSTALTVGWSVSRPPSSSRLIKSPQPTGPIDVRGSESPGRLQIGQHGRHR